MSMTLSGAVGRDLPYRCSVIPKQQALNTDSAAVRDLPLCLQSPFRLFEAGKGSLHRRIRSILRGADPSTCVGPRMKALPYLYSSSAYDQSVTILVVFASVT